MKKRLLTVLLAVCLVVALGTVTAAAADEDEQGLNQATLENIAQVDDSTNSTRYWDLHAGNYKLTGNIVLDDTIEGAQYISLRFGEGVSTLDLNGYSITSNSMAAITNKGTLTINDSRDSGTITGVRGIDNYGSLIINKGKVTVSSANVAGYAVQMRAENASLTMNGGVLESVNKTIGFENGKSKNIQINLLGGIVGDISLAGGTTKNPNTLNIGSNDVQQSGEIKVGAIDVLSLSQWNINLYSGTVESIAKSRATYTVGNTIIKNNINCPGGYKFVAVPDGFKLVESNDVVAAIGNAEYNYLPNAIAALKDNQTITLMADYKVSNTSEIINIQKSNVTLDLNGHNITSSAPSSPVVCSGAASGTFTITNSSTTSTNASITPDEDHGYEIAAVSVRSNSSVTLNIEGNVTVDGVRLSSGGRIADTADNRELLSYDASMDNLYAVRIGSEAYIYGGGNISAIGFDAKNKGMNEVAAILLGDADDGITYGNSDVALTVELDGNEVTSVGNAAVGIPSGANGTSLTVKNGTVRGQISAAGASSEECRLTLINLDMTSNGDAGVAANGALSDGLKLTLKDCTLRSTNDNNMTTGIFFPVEGGVLTIDNSTITGYNTGVQAYAGSVTIKGAGTEITGSGVSVLNPDKDGKPATTGPIFDGSAISIIDRITEYGGFESITIEDGSFSTETGSGENGAVHVASENAGVPGSFAPFDNSQNIVQVSGGTFTSSVSEYVTDELKAELYSAANGTYTYYSSEEAASANAKPGDIISDVKETVEYNVRVVYGNGTADTLATVKNKATFILPDTLSRNGYTFGGWRGSDGKVYKAGETVKVTSDMTFTAIWNAINIPDTYDIEIADTANGEVSTSLSNASAGSTITITAEPDTGYSVGSVTVTGPDGRVDVTRVNATTYTFKMPEGDVTVRVTFTTGLPFTDVSANQWFYEAVSYVYTNGMMEGDSATTFNPDGRMTRAMFWAVLGRIDGATITGANWVETARSWAMAEGVSDGTNPNDYVTREMMVTMLWRYAGEPASEESLSGYSDAASVSDWAAEAMSWALETGVIEGVTATTLQPQGTATRAQCATIFMRYDALVA